MEEDLELVWKHKAVSICLLISLLHLSTIAFSCEQ